MNIEFPAFNPPSPSCKNVWSDSRGACYCHRTPEQPRHWGNQSPERKESSCDENPDPLTKTFIDIWTLKKCSYLAQWGPIIQKVLIVYRQHKRKSKLGWSQTCGSPKAAILQSRNLNVCAEATCERDSTRVQEADGSECASLSISEQQEERPRSLSPALTPNPCTLVQHRNTTTHSGPWHRQWERGTLQLRTGELWGRT